MTELFKEIMEGFLEIAEIENNSNLKVKVLDILAHSEKLEEAKYEDD